MEILEIVLSVLGTLLAIAAFAGVIWSLLHLYEVIFKRQYKNVRYFKFVYPCFPTELKRDVEAAFAAMPNRTVNCAAFATDNLLREYELTSGTVSFPYRLYFVDANEEKIENLTDRQKKILYCLYKRSNDGYLREKYAKKLLDAGLEEWCLPFIVSLCDDYVVEIVEAVYSALSERNNDDIKAFCKRNESSVRKSYSRMVSYWNEYYRRTDKHWKINEYVGRKLFKECLGIYE